MVDFKAFDEILEQIQAQYRDTNIKELISGIIEIKRKYIYMAIKSLLNDNLSISTSKGIGLDLWGNLLHLSRYIPSDKGDNYAYFNGKKWYTGDYISDSHRKLGSEISTIKSMPNKYGISADINTAETNNYYLIHHYDINDSNLESNSGWKGSDISLTAYLVTNDEGNLISWDHEDINQLYPNGFSNEICQAFEVYVGDKLPGFNIMAPLSTLIKMVKYGNSSQFGPAKKKVNPKEQEQNSKGLNLKAIFKSDENWDLRGLANINRADVNAVGLGQWITFPICSTHNLALRDIDYSNVTEQAQFARKRGFFPLKAMDSKNPMRDSNVINQATAISIPNKKYYLFLY